MTDDEISRKLIVIEGFVRSCATMAAVIIAADLAMLPGNEAPPDSPSPAPARPDVAD